MTQDKSSYKPEAKTFITKRSKDSRNDPDGIKSKTICMKDLKHRIQNRNFTHITQKVEELSEKGLMSFGPKMTRLDALGEDIERALEKGLEEIYQSKQERADFKMNKELSAIKERHSSHK